MSTGLAVFTLFHVALSVAGIIRLGADFRETVENLDQHISADYHSDQRDRILVSVPQILAFAWRWNRFLAGFGDDDSGSLRLSPCRCLAARLCYRRGQRALSERLRVDRAVFNEDSRAQGSGAHTKPPFLGTQIVVMLIFIVLGVLATRRFPGQPVHVS